MPGVNIVNNIVFYEAMLSCELIYVLQREQPNQLQYVHQEGFISNVRSGAMPMWTMISTNM